MLKFIRAAAWAAIALLAIAAGLVMLGLRPSQIDTARLPLAISIGGPFELTAQDGRRVSDKDLLGRPFAVFFGFTNCPDVCPTTLLEMSNRLAELGPGGDKLRVVFISVDPEQDTPEHLKAYVANFDPRILALTGSPTEIAEVAKKYRAVYQKVPTKAGYTMDHTATVYLMDAQGKFAGTIAYQEAAETQRAKLARLVGQP
jgi:protein SCO1/2